MALLERYDYPGNVRELENAIEHAVALAEADEIGADDLPPAMRDAAAAAARAQTTAPPVLAGARPRSADRSGAVAPRTRDGWSLADIEKEHIQRVLDAPSRQRDRGREAARHLAHHAVAQAARVRPQRARGARVDVNSERLYYDDSYTTRFDARDRGRGRARRPARRSSSSDLLLSRERGPGGGPGADRRAPVVDVQAGDDGARVARGRRADRRRGRPPRCGRGGLGAPLRPHAAAHRPAHPVGGLRARALGADRLVAPRRGAQQRRGAHGRRRLARDRAPRARGEPGRVGGPAGRAPLGGRARARALRAAQAARGDGAHPHRRDPRLGRLGVRRHPHAAHRRGRRDQGRALGEGAREPALRVPVRRPRAARTTPGAPSRWWRPRGGAR